MSTTRVTSNEDGILDRTTLVTSRVREYKDIDLFFEPTLSGELVVKKDAAAVKQAIKNLLLTNYFEKPFNPFFGANLADQLFELADDLSAANIERRIQDTIEAFEPRALVQSVKAELQPDYNSLRVTVTFQVVNSTEIVTFTTLVSRLR